MQDGARMRERRRMRPQMGDEGCAGCAFGSYRLGADRFGCMKGFQLTADILPRLDFFRAVKRGFRPQPGRETIGAGAGEPSLRASIGLSLLGHAACPRPS